MNFEDLENKRKIYVEKRKKIMKKAYGIAGGILGGVILVILIMVLTANSEEKRTAIVADGAVPFFVFLIVALVIVSGVINHFTRKELAEYKSGYQTYFILGSLEKKFMNIQYNPESGMPKEVVERVMTSGDRYNSNDLITASYQGVNFKQADVHTERMVQTTDSDGHVHTHYETIFLGRFLVFDFNRNFTFNLQVSSKRFPGEVLPKDPNKKLKFQRIKTESGDFNRSFIVYGQDGVDTLYILDPAFMEKIQALYDNLGCEICLTFMDKELYIALNTRKDSFKVPNPKKPLIEEVEMGKVQKDIELITGFVDNLDLDRYKK